MFGGVFFQTLLRSIRLKTDGSQNAPNTMAIMNTKAAPIANRSRLSVRLIASSFVIDLSPKLAELTMAARGLPHDGGVAEPIVSLTLH